MRRSNSKEARRAVEAYVLDTIEYHIEADEREIIRPVSRYYGILKDEMSFQSYRSGDREILGAGLAKKARSAGRYSFVAANSPYWVWYLAVFQGEFIAYTGDAYDAIKSWLDETEEEAEHYNADQAWHMYAHMTAQAFKRLYERENTPHRIPTAEFIRLYQEHNGGHYFDRDTLKYWGETRRSFTVEGFHLITDDHDKQRDCYAVFHTITAPTGERFPKVDYFDRETIAPVFPKEA